MYHVVHICTDVYTFVHIMHVYIYVYKFVYINNFLGILHLVMCMHM